MGDIDTYALESYDTETGFFSRHDVGDISDIRKLLDEHVSKDVESCDSKKYYRIVKISEQDKKLWDKQVELLPYVPNEEKLFGEWVQINTAARYLGVTFGRVFNLVTSGQVEATTTSGRNKLVSSSDLIDRRIYKPRSGRPNHDSEVKNPNGLGKSHESSDAK